MVKKMGNRSFLQKKGISLFIKLIIMISILIIITISGVTYLSTLREQKVYKLELELHAELLLDTIREYAEFNIGSGLTALQVVDGSKDLIKQAFK